MTDWIVSNAWWFAPALTFAGVGMFIAALGWPRSVTNRHQPRPLASWYVPDDEAFDAALVAGEPLPWERVD